SAPLGAPMSVPHPSSRRSPIDQLYELGVLYAVSSASTVLGATSSDTPGTKVFAIVLFGITGLVMNGGLRRLPEEPPPRRALWKSPALACSAIFPWPVRTQAKAGASGG